MKPFTPVTSPAAPLDLLDVDTDQIIPARFLKRPRTDGYGNFLFHDLRRAPDGALRQDFVLNRPEYRSAIILVANANFGCGSSREGAVYALLDYGFRAVIAPSFGDIFYNNSLRNGLLPIVLPADVVAGLRRLAAERPATQFHIDLARQSLSAGDGTAHGFEIDPFRKICLLEGLEDIDVTNRYAERIEAFRQAYFRRHRWLAPLPP